VKGKGPDVSNADKEVFELKGKDAEAIGEPVDGGFVVRKGAIARKEIVPSATDYVTPLRSQLLSEGVLVEEDGKLRFTKDHVFDSPSGAAATVLGTIANGWITWKTVAGVTLNDAKQSPKNGVLSPEKRRQIIEKHRQLLNDGKFVTENQLDRYYTIFREQFGPEVLAKLDGEPLLELMHNQSNKDSLGYWLEFKNDDEFDTRRFGSIAGGSALKFGVFRRKETGNWQAADKSNYPTDISLEEAIEFARKHRDQLLRGVKLLEAFPSIARDEDYAQLQLQMDQEAPNVSNLSWGHKYFCLLFPDKLDDFHNAHMQSHETCSELQQQSLC